MCGIFCIYNSEKSRIVERHLVVNATDEMTHRGPDDSGIYISGNVGLGHRRLSIIDISSGHQPMFNEDGKIALVYNGEIYNYERIRNDLLKKGHVFQTNCDTEVIIHAYEEWGVDSVKKFNGMFAFALYDERNESIWVVRDRLGIKPLYYFWDKKTFLCSSEIKPLLKTGLVQPELNEKVLDAYLSIGYVPGPETLFKNIKKLRPGHFLKLNKRELNEKEYWDFADVEPSNLCFEDAKDKLNELIKDSVKKRLMSDVPLGVFLSGGLDSSAIVSTMSQFTNTPINTFTVGYDKKFGTSEERYALMVAEKYKTEHHVFKLEPDNFFSSLNTLVHYTEEPLVESPAIALYCMSKLAREKAIVLLSGEGGDEVFAGYMLYQIMQQFDRFQKNIPGWFDKIIEPIRPLVPKNKYHKYLDWLMQPLDKRYQGTSGYLTESVKKAFYSSDFLQSRGSYLPESFAFHFKRTDSFSDIINKMLYVDTKTWLADDLLLKADKMTMAASIELRVPFLDHRIVEFASSLPSSFKCRNGKGKYIIKSLMENKLPKEIIDRKKAGFPIPTQKWFSGDLFPSIKEYITDSKHYLPWINKIVIKKILNEHRNGSQDHSRIILTLLILIIWQKEFRVKI